jgi:hypothetical protein
MRMVFRIVKEPRDLSGLACNLTILTQVKIELQVERVRRSRGGA